MTEGWRFWIVRAGEHVLRSPYDLVPIEWHGAELRAVCTTDASHVPPAAGCGCGVYADPTEAIINHRVKVYRSTLPPGRATETTVIGRVELVNAVPFSYRPPGLALLAPGRTWPDELRAASARIIELRILANSALPPDRAAELCRHLEATYRRPATYVEGL